MPLFDWGRDPWAAFRDIQRELGRALGLNVAGESEYVGGSSYPPVSLFDRADSCLVLAEVPGVPMENLDISLTDRTLVIKGAKPDDGVPRERYHRRERGSGTFARTVVLPDPVKPDAIKATLARGILRIELPKSESARPHRIGVKAG